MIKDVCYPVTCIVLFGFIAEGVTLLYFQQEPRLLVMRNTAVTGLSIGSFQGETWVPERLLVLFNTTMASRSPETAWEAVVFQGFIRVVCFLIVFWSPQREQIGEIGCAPTHIMSDPRKADYSRPASG